MALEVAKRKNKKDVNFVLSHMHKITFMEGKYCLLWWVEICVCCLFWFGCRRQQKRHAATPPPAGVRRRMERNRQKPVRRDKGSLTEQQTKGTATTTIQKRGILKTNPQNRTALSDRTAAEPSGAHRTAPPPTPEPSMTAHGMEYPALFGQVGVGSAHPAVPLPGFW